MIRKKVLSGIFLGAFVALVLLSMPTLQVRAHSVYTTDNQLLIIKPGWGVQEWLWANVDGYRSGGNVVIRQFYFDLWHYQYKHLTNLPLPGYPLLSIPIIVQQYLTTLTVTFSGDGFTTTTLKLVENGVYKGNVFPSWMTVTDLYYSTGDPLAYRFEVHIYLYKSFYSGADATMTVRAAGWTSDFFYIWYTPFDVTYSVSCSAWIEYD